MLDAKIDTLLAVSFLSWDFNLACTCSKIFLIYSMFDVVVIDGSGASRLLRQREPWPPTTFLKLLDFLKC